MDAARRLGGFPDNDDEDDDEADGDTDLLLQQRQHPRVKFWEQNRRCWCVIVVDGHVRVLQHGSRLQLRPGALAEDRSSSRSSPSLRDRGPSFESTHAADTRVFGRPGTGGEGGGWT